MSRASRDCAHKEAGFTVSQRGVCGTRPCILPRSLSPALGQATAACAFERGGEGGIGAAAATRLQTAALPTQLNARRADTLGGPRGRASTSRPPDRARRCHDRRVRDQARRRTRDRRGGRDPRAFGRGPRATARTKKPDSRCHKGAFAAHCRAFCRGRRPRRVPGAAA